MMMYDKTVCPVVIVVRANFSKHQAVQKLLIYILFNIRSLVLISTQVYTSSYNCHLIMILVTFSYITAIKVNTID